MKLIHLDLSSGVSDGECPDRAARASGQRGEDACADSLPRPRRAWIALILGLMAPGLGHFYACRPRRAATAAAVFFLLLIPVGTYLPVCLAWSPLLTVLGYLLAMALILLVPVDGWLTARRHPTAKLTRWNRVWIYAAFFLVFRLVLPAIQAGLLMLAPTLPWRQFGVPTGAMIPTLLVGDEFIADMRDSAVESLKRGDIVLFEAPGEPTKLWTKRIVGLPGEVIEIRDKTVIVDGNPLDEPYKVHETEYSHDAWSRIAQGLVAEATHDVEGQGHQPAVRVDSAFFNLPPQRIPADAWFLLGDNRDNSKDSRAYGPVPTNLIRGRVTRIHWSRGAELWDIRWRRLGMSLEGTGQATD